MYKRLLFPILLTAGVVANAAALAQEVPAGREVLHIDSLAGVRPRAAGESVQGIAVHGTTLFTLYHGGDCVVADLDGNRFLAEFTVEAAAGTHCNNASFGVERAGDGSEFPMLYISECGAPSRCFVVDISPRGAEAVATIRYAGGGIAEFCDWCVDRENRHLYAYGKSTDGGAVLKRFDLPTLERMTADGGETILGDDDVLCEYGYPAGFFHIPQGSCIRNGMIYLPTGVPSAGSRFIHVVDLADGVRKALYTLDSLPFEPEGASPCGGELAVMFGERGSSGRLMLFDIFGTDEGVAE